MNKNFFAEIKAVRYIHNREKGQGLTEFALTVSIFLILVIGIMEMAWLFYFYNTIATAAREASRYGAGWEKTDSYANFKDCVGIQNAAKRIAWVAGLQDADIQIYVFSGHVNEASPGTPELRCIEGDANRYPIDKNGVGQFDRMYVRVTGHYKPLIGIIPIPNIDLVADSSNTIMQDIAISDK